MYEIAIAIIAIVMGFGFLVGLIGPEFFKTKTK